MNSAWLTAAFAMTLTRRSQAWLPDTSIMTADIARSRPDFTALEMAGPDLHIRPLSASIAFHVGLVIPDLRAPSPLLAAFEGSLFEAAKALAKRLKRAGPDR